MAAAADADGTAALDSLSLFFLFLLWLLVLVGCGVGLQRRGDCSLLLLVVADGAGLLLEEVGRGVVIAFLLFACSMPFV